MKQYLFVFRLWSFLMVAVLWPCLGTTGEPAAAEASVAPPAESALRPPVAEDLSYDIAFLWFDRLAEAKLSLSPGNAPGTWQSQLEARTLGVAAWLTRDRLQRYGSKMDFDNQGRLRSLIYNADIIKTKEGERHSRLKSYLFDYDGGTIVRQVVRNGVKRPNERLAMPAEAPYDILTAFYNFRRGVYGEIRPGGHYRIPTLGNGEMSEIVVDIFPENRPRDRRFPQGGLLAKVKLDPEVFDTGEGILYIWFDEQRRPALVLVEDVIGLGNVRCILRERG